jgi:hypothetical protein
MSFVTPWYLLGLLGIGIPLAIHLIRRQRAERVMLPTVRFLRRAPKKLVYFQRIQQWLLLMLRVAIVGLLALAFARPILTGAYSEMVGAVPQSLVILLDTSMSMRYADRFSQGKAAVIDILKSLKKGDEAGIITFADGTGPMKPLTTDLAALETFVRRIPAPGYRSTDFLTALRLADQVLHSAHYQAKTVYLVSDYQQVAVPAGTGLWKLSAGVRFEGINVADAETSNLTVTDITAVGHHRDPEKFTIIGRIKNVGTDSVPQARVSLRIDGAQLADRAIALRDRSEIVVKFPVTFTQAGLHRGTLTIAGDRFEPDNIHYFSVHVEPPLRVLCVNGESADGRDEDEAFWFRSALIQRSKTRFHVDVVKPAQLTLESLASYAVVALLNVHSLSPQQLGALGSYVKGGGGLLLAPADRVDGVDYNRDFMDLTPALLQKKQIHSDGPGVVISQVQERHPIVRSLKDGEKTDFGKARFHGYWSTDPASGSEVIMRFDNGDAALLARRVGNGRVLLFTSSLDPEWNNFPRQVTYLPLLHETVRYLAASRDKKMSYRVGDLVPVAMPPDGAARVTSPQGVETLLRSKPQGPVFYQATDAPGFYQTRSGSLVGSFAVNVPPRESELASVDPEEIRDRLIDSETAGDTAGAQQSSPLRIALEKSQRSWWWVLLLVLVLSLFETLLANRTYR